MAPPVNFSLYKDCQQKFKVLPASIFSNITSTGGVNNHNNTQTIYREMYHKKFE